VFSALEVLPTMRYINLHLTFDTGPVAVSFLADTMNLQYSYSTAKRIRG